MPKGKQGLEDANETAYRVFQESIGESVSKPEKVKNQAAVELGRMGGKVGGKARAASLTPEKRTEIAKRAAAVRWKT